MENQNKYKVVLNNGYYNVKGKNLIFKSCCEEINDSMEFAFSNTIKYDGITYAVGQGQPNLNLAKDANLINKILILYAISQKVNVAKANIELVLSAPPLSYLNQRSTLPLYLLGKHEIAVNGNDYRTYNIEDVVVLPETFVVFANNNDNSKYDEDVLVIIDIGGFTTNICKIEYGGFSLNQCYSYPHGMYHLDTRIAQFLSKTYSGENFSCTDKDIPRYRKNGLYLDNIKGNIMETQKDNIESIHKTFIQDIINSYIKMGWNIGDYHKLITGGGGLILFDTIQKYFFKNATLSKNPIFDNYIGLEIISASMEEDI